MIKSKRFKDPIYGYIDIDETIISTIVDTAGFQRLRNVIQTSYSPLYSSAVHNRFVHSLGVYHLGCIVSENIARNKDGFVEIGEIDRYLKIFEYFGALEHFDMQKIKIARWCEGFRSGFSEFEGMVKAEYLREMLFYQRDFDFKQGVLVRSVDGLDFYYGHWGVKYHVLSTRIFSTDNPEWYLKGWRNLMLLYRISSPDDVLAMFHTDGSTYCHYLPFADLRLTATPAFYVDKLLVDDGPEKGLIASMGLWYQCAYPYSQLTGCNLCEIVLDSSVRPEGVLIGDLEVYHNSKLAESTEVFARYYQLLIYVFINVNVTLLKTYKK